MSGQVQSELSARGTKQDVENTPNPLTVSWTDDPVYISRLQGGIGPSDHDGDEDNDDNEDDKDCNYIEDEEKSTQ